MGRTCGSAGYKLASILQVSSLTIMRPLLRAEQLCTLGVESSLDVSSKSAAIRTCCLAPYRVCI